MKACAAAWVAKSLQSRSMIAVAGDGAKLVSPKAARARATARQTCVINGGAPLW